MVRIAPYPGLVVIGPDGRQLPADGIEIAEAAVSRFWRRRLDDGDVTITTVATDTADTTAKKKG